MARCVRLRGEQELGPGARLRRVRARIAGYGQRVHLLADAHRFAEARGTLVLGGARRAPEPILTLLIFTDALAQRHGGDAVGRLGTEAAHMAALALALKTDTVAQAAWNRAVGSCGAGRARGPSPSRSA